MRVVIAEDLALLRDGMVRLLEANGFEVVAAVDNADALCTPSSSTAPTSRIVDIRLPPTFRDEGLRAALELRADLAGDGDPRRLAVRRAHLRRGAAAGAGRRAASATCSRTA